MPPDLDDFSTNRRAPISMHPLLKIALIVAGCTLFLLLILLKGG